MKEGLPLCLYFVDPSFNQTQANPFDGNRPYGEDWIMLKLVESADFTLFTGGGTDGIFRLVLTKATDHWPYRLFDFIGYESALGKHIILAINGEDYEAARRLYHGHSHKDTFLRPYEHPILVHTTTKQSAAAIMDDRCLKSWNALHRLAATRESAPIGSLLGDPPDYRDYIMFSNGGVSVERVVSSRQRGSIEMDIDAPYIAGARFYFHGAKVARSGLLVRDGAHLKVRDALPLADYLLWTATPETLGIPALTTPRLFAETADQAFQAQFAIPLNRDS